MQQVKFPASIQGLMDIFPEADVKGVAHTLVNLLPRDLGLEIRKGFKFYKRIPLHYLNLEYVNRHPVADYPTIVSPVEAPVKLFSLDRFSKPEDPRQDWSIFLAISSSIYQLEFHDGEPPQLGDTTEELIINTDPNSVQDFPRPAATHYTDLSGQNNLVICSAQTSLPAAFTPGRTSNTIIYFSTSSRNDAPELTVVRELYIEGTNVPKPTDDLFFPIFHDNRLFFLQEGTSSFFYSEATGQNPFRDPSIRYREFRIGYTQGQNLFAATLSTDTSDAGPNKWIAFVSTEGEVHIYPNLNILNPSDTTYRGRFRIGKPLGGVESFMEINGDVLVATEWGLISLQSAIQKSVLIGESNVASPIADTWRQLVEKTKGKGPWFVQRTPTFDKFMVISPAGESFSLAWCLDTKAWTTIDKPIQSVAEYADKTFYASGRDIFTYEGGQDVIFDATPEGTPQQINATWIPKATDLGNIFAKTVKNTWLRYESANKVKNRVTGLNMDESVALQPGPTALDPVNQTDEQKYFRASNPVNKDTGSIISLAVQLAINQPKHPNLRLTSLFATYEQNKASPDSGNG